MNVTEAQIIALQVRAEAVKTSVIAMQANDATRAETGAGHYTEESYDKAAQELYAISNQIHQLATGGWL